MIANESLNFNDLSGVCGPRGEQEAVDGRERNDNDRALKGWSLKASSNFQIKFFTSREQFCFTSEKFEINKRNSKASTMVVGEAIKRPYLWPYLCCSLRRFCWRYVDRSES